MPKAFVIIGLSVLGPVLCIVGCVVLACVLLKKQKRKVRPHISVATKSAAPDDHLHHPPAPPPPPPLAPLVILPAPLQPQSPPQPPHAINGGVYRTHDISVQSYPTLPTDSQSYPSSSSAPPYPTNPPSYGPNPSVYYDSVE
uniref:Uncharacterized protein n=1 Tax=Panagrolaimus sp. ES5 TaxID=591445 RepID=A0AC34G7I7_9BILA